MGSLTCVFEPYPNLVAQLHHILPQCRGVDSSFKIESYPIFSD